MEEEPLKDQGSENSAADRAVIFKFGVLLFVGLLIAYGKFLWPLVFGRMQSEGITFMAAIQDTSLHAIAFATLAVCWVAAALWVFLREC